MSQRRVTSVVRLSIARNIFCTVFVMIIIMFPLFFLTFSLLMLATELHAAPPVGEVYGEVHREEIQPLFFFFVCLCVRLGELQGYATEFQPGARKFNAGGRPNPITVPMVKVSCCRCHNLASVCLLN